MSEMRISERYARALEKLEKIIPREVAKQSLDSMTDLFTETKFAKILRSPVVPTDLKKDVLFHVLGASATSGVKAFVTEVVEAGRVALIPRIQQSYLQLCDAADGVIRGKLIGTSSDDESVLKEIEQYLSKELGKDVALQFESDPALLGGFVIRMGNLHIDLSVKNRISSLAQQALA